MKPFIRATEIWLPSDDQTLLEFGGGLFGPANGFAAASRTMCFGRAEGLPGQAWDEGHPILLKHFEGSHFQRTVVAKVAGLTCAVAVPFFLRDKLTAVLVFFGSDDDATAGAIELWRNDPRITSDMTLADGYYGGTPPEFEGISRETYLPRGMGLPGMAWQRESAVIMDDLGPNTRFLRGDAATDAGIRRGLAFPCCSQTHASYVLTLLSAKETPLASRIERWLPQADQASLGLAGGYCEAQGNLAPDSLPVIALSASDNPVASAFLHGTPVLSGQNNEAASNIGGLVAIPVISEDQVTEVIALYF